MVLQVLILKMYNGYIMSSSVTRDHHNLRRNLKLNDNYISNDGGDEGLTVDDAGDVGINIPTTITPITKLEVFNSNVQYSTGTAYQNGFALIGSGVTFTSAMVGGRFVFDDGTDAGIITYFIHSTALVVSTSQTVGASDDLRSYKIYYPSVQIDTGASSTSLKIGNMSISKDEIALSTQGNFTVDAIGNFTVDAALDIALSSDGGNVTLDDGSTTVFDFDVDNVVLKIMDDADTGDYFSIGVADNGSTTLTTVDDDGEGANMVFTADGSIVLKTATSDPTGVIVLNGANTVVNPNTRTVSGTSDSSLHIKETLDLGSGEAGGSDVHYGIRYIQTQTDLGGWNSVYLMYIYGGDAARTIVIRDDGKVGIGVTDPASPLEIFNTASQLKISYDDTYYTDISVDSDGILEIATTGSTSSDIILDAAGNVYLEPGRYVYFQRSGTNDGQVLFDLNTNPLIAVTSDDAAADKFELQVNASGATTMTTIDASAADAHLTIVADGHVEFDGCGVGFDKLSGTFGTSAVIDSPNDGTDIDFRLGNKYELILSDDMGSDDLLNLIFPAVSGNFILVLIHDPGGGYDIHDDSWLAYASDGSLGDNTLAEDLTDGVVRWAGGTTPTLSANGRDIDVISIYWDADNQTALAVASLDFG